MSEGSDFSFSLPVAREDLKFFLQDQTAPVSIVWPHTTTHHVFIHKPWLPKAMTVLRQRQESCFSNPGAALYWQASWILLCTPLFPLVVTGISQG